MSRRIKDLRSKLNQFDSMLRMARASELAALGHYDLAKTILTSDQKRHLQHEELDVLARIHVRRADYRAAEDCWNQAISLAPSSEAKEYETCLSSMNQWLRHKQDLLIWKLRFFMWFCAVAIAVWLIVRLMTSKG